MAHGTAFLLLSAAVGYWVLERASTQKKDLKTIGQIVGAIIIVVSFAGVACKVYTVSKWGKAIYCPAKTVCPAGPACPFSSKQPSGKSGGMM